MSVNSHFLNLDTDVTLSSNSDTIIPSQKAIKTYADNKLIFFGTSTTAKATVQKEVSIPSITSLETGTIIVVQPTVTSTVANSTLKLNNFTAYPMLYNNAAITTDTDSVVWNANYPCMWVFDGSNWRLVAKGLDSNSTYSMDYLNDQGPIKIGGTSTDTQALSRYSLVMQLPDMSWQKITNTTEAYSTGTSKTVNTNGFLLPTIKYYNTTTIVVGGGTAATRTIRPYSPNVDLRYSTNCGDTPGWTLGDYIYLVGTISNDLFYLDTTTWWTNTLPSTNDGKYYIRVGVVVSDYSCSLLLEHPVYYHNGTSLCTYLVADNKQDVIGYTPANDSSVVHLTGNETISGTKTFTSNIVGDLTGNASTATSATKATQDGSGNTITTTYATKSELSSKQDTITGGASSITSTDLTASRALQSDANGKVSVSSVTSTELGYLSGVTSAIQTQLNGKQATITGGASTIVSNNFTANRAIISNSSGKAASSSVTSTELGYLSGISSQIQQAKNLIHTTSASYIRLVIGLCKLTANNTSSPTFSSGTITSCRNSAVSNLMTATISIQGRYSSDYTYMYSFFSNQFNSSTDARSGTGFRPCKFKYNDEWYGGLEFYEVQNRGFYWIGETNTTHIVVEYYNANTSTVLNDEVNNSLEYGTGTLIPLTIDRSVADGDGNKITTTYATNTNLDTKQPKTLDTAITVDGTSQTTVEGALGAINTLAESKVEYAMVIKEW